MISIIVPVYKVEKYIAECIESILAQTFTDFELILVDDGSIDKSSEICDQFAEMDSRVKVFHKTNGGVSSARNYGIEHASGEWLCFVDGDDIIQTTYLEDFELDKADADIYMQGYVKVKGEEIISRHSFINCRNKNFYAVLAYSEENFINNSPCFKLFKKSIINANNIRFDTNTSYGEDHLFSLLYILYAHSIHFSLSEGYIYRINETESLTQRVVPYKEITYYALNAKRIHDIICSNSVDYSFMSTAGLVLMTNYIRTLKYLAKGKSSYKDFKWVRNSFLPELRKISTKKISKKNKILRQISIQPIYHIIYLFVIKLFKI